MSLLTPLGLLGLLGIVALIIIYILKPNYQQRMISSTYVWKLSLKYRRKKIPISKLRNIILIICQILILTASAFILTNPVNIVETFMGNDSEAIIVIDSSASMRAEADGESRFERAVNQALELTESIYKEDGAVVSVILADHDPDFLVDGKGFESRYTVEDELNGLLYNDECSYGTSDIKGAMALCETKIKDNPSAQVYFFTDTTYSYTDKKVRVINVANTSEWNAAILDAHTVLEDNVYAFYVDIACYGRSEILDLTINVSGANKNVIEGGEEVSYTFPSILCEMDKTIRVVFRDIAYKTEDIEDQDGVLYYWIDPVNSDDVKVNTYEQVFIELTTYGSSLDSILIDNTFQLFNGEREPVKIQYASAEPNSFINVALLGLPYGYASSWDISVKSVKVGDEPALEGYDFYFFEHRMPEKMPTDGVVVLINPINELGQIPSSAGVRAGVQKASSGLVPLVAEEDHPILTWVDVTRFEVTQYVSLSPSPEYRTLASVNGDPVLLVKDEAGAKVVVVGFTVHFSTQAITEYNMLLTAGIFEHFMPSTVQSNSYEVNEKITVNARGDELIVYLDGDSTTDFAPITEFPSELPPLKIPGVYVLQQETWAGKDITEYIYVNAPAVESNVWKKETTFETPYTTEKKEPLFNDWLIWIAAAIVALMFVEWWLQGRDNA